MKVYDIKEHRFFEDTELVEIKKFDLDFSSSDTEVKYLGLNRNIQASYYIGIDWLKEGEAAIKVNPKVKGLDVMKMFLECLNTPYLNRELEKIYHIDLDNPTIKIENNPFDITPMLIIHFISVLKNLVSKGLKKDYITREENLNSKVKGKIKFSQHLKKNIAKGRYDRNYCRYQDYSIDCVENQLLKKTLRFSISYLSRFYKEKTAFVAANYCMSAFEDVSDDIEAFMIKKVRVNPLFKEYAEAFKLAKMILRKFAYSMSETSKLETKKTPPYWIDMSLLFEIYVYGKLREEYGSTIQYQAKGKYGNTDFLKKDEKIVIDTKYKLIYNIERYEIENIRQISGYARDIGIRDKLKAKNDELLPCCIIYPNQLSPSDFSNRGLLTEEPIQQFEKFWKIGIALPVNN